MRNWGAGRPERRIRPAPGAFFSGRMSSPRWLRTGVKVAAILALAAGSAAITRASLGYFGDEMPPFVIEKLPLPHEEMWLWVLKVHVLAAAICLPSCLLLVSTTVVRRLSWFHRWLGRITGPLALFALVPSGAYLALFAKGGLASTIGFLLSGSIIAVAMVLGVVTARKRRFLEHRRWMLHVLAQMSVAVTSRAMLFGFDAAGVDERTAYLVSLWLPVLGSFVVVELLSTRARALASARRRHAAASPAPRAASAPTAISA